MLPKNLFRSTKNRKPLSAANCSAGFTLVELLTVMAIMTILTTAVTLSLNGLEGSQSMTAAGSDIQGMLDRARSLAMSHNTYVWVGFYEENPNAAQGTAGTGRLVVSTVESLDGTELYSTANPPAQLDPSHTKLSQAYRLEKIPKVHLDVVSASAVPRSEVPDDPYQLGDDNFSNGITFQYPLTGNAVYTFSKIIQFNPQGDATRIGDVPTTLMEIGLQPANGGVANAASKNLASLQVEGIGGKVTLYRP